MTVSIIICTRDRADSLKLTMESIGKAGVPSTWTVELLIVDNGSSDATEATVSATTLPNMSARYIRELRCGLGYARNTGIAAAQGRVLLFTDDDTRVPRDWIEGMCRPIIHGGADAVAGGVGFPSSIDDALAQSPFSLRRGWFASTEELDRNMPLRMVGANMAFGRHVLDRVPGFDTELGAGALGFAEETLFSYQLLSAGYKLCGALDVLVDHHFDPTRLTRANMINLSHKMGRSHAFVFHHWELKTSRLVLPRMALGHLHRMCLRCSEWIGRNGETISDRRLRVEEHLAFCREYIAQRQRRRKYAPSADPRH